jgi:hypothetical protein
MRPRLLLLCAAAALLASCRDESISTYRVPKDAPSPVVPAPATAATSDITWILPAGWTTQPDPSGMRKGSFLVSGADGAKADSVGGAKADMSVTAFPGDVGGDLANVNRWRGQVGLAPIDDAALAQAVQTIDAPAGKFSFIELSGTASGAQKPERLLGAWLQQPDRRWFFKLKGDDALVTAQHDAFFAFLKSVSFAAAPPAVAGPAKAQSTNDLPKAPFAPFAGGAMPDTGTTPDANSAPAPAPADSTTPQASLTWTAPADWQAKPLSTMRIGSFAVSSDAGTADISIVAFPGEAGGLLANINRWRGQLGLAPLAEGDLASATTMLDGAGGLHFTVVDLSGQTAGAESSGAGVTPARMLGAILSFGGQTYFFKLTGPDALVAREKTTFLDFLKTVKAP